MSELETYFLDGLTFHGSSFKMWLLWSTKKIFGLQISLGYIWPWLRGIDSRQSGYGHIALWWGEGTKSSPDWANMSTIWAVFITRFAWGVILTARWIKPVKLLLALLCSLVYASSTAHTRLTVLNWLVACVTWYFWKNTMHTTTIKLCKLIFPSNVMSFMSDVTFA